jgi:hypothetical protein
MTQTNDAWVILRSLLAQMSFHRCELQVIVIFALRQFVSDIVRLADCARANVMENVRVCELDG